MYGGVGGAVSNGGAYPIMWRVFISRIANYLIDSCHNSVPKFVNRLEIGFRIRPPSNLCGARIAIDLQSIPRAVFSGAAATPRLG